MAHLFKRKTTKHQGDEAEDWALAHLQAQGLRLLTRQFKTPGRGGGEVDLIMQERDGTVVFVEVRRRSSAAFGGAWASVDGRKRQRLVLAARHYLQSWGHLPPCRFDVVGVQAAAQGQAWQIDWLQAAFFLDGG